ncbi:MAG: TonB-dependent receptor [Tannerellaceae bacterium]|nr:TonB-dependent receptor [Tannerellaceae bacterium]
MKLLIILLFSLTLSLQAHTTHSQSTKINQELDNASLSETLKEIGKQSETPGLLQNIDRKQITGTVTDAQGEPLTGANIVEKGVSNGVITDLDGKFSLSVAENAVLQISFIGYISQEIQIKNQNRFQIVLKEDFQALEEVVVIGYGTAKKSDLTGSVSSLTPRQFQDQPITRLDQAINGRIPGVMVITNSGSPEQSIQVRIRGANSIYGGNDPLYIIDGVPNGTLFNSLDPNDIQSIEVLKDASATAIYGSRGANGVVLVTTRRGAEGKTRITFETHQTVSSLAKTLDMLSASDYAEFYNKYRGIEFYTQEQINNWKINGGTDWQDLIFRTAYTQNYKLSLSGGTQKNQYLVSGNFLDAQGILLESETQRYNIRSNLTSEVTDWLKMNLELNAIRRKTRKNGPRGGISTVIADALTYTPSMELKDAEGNWNRDMVNSILDNPYGRLIQDLSDGFSNYFSGNLQLNFKLPVKGLTFKLQGFTSYGSSKGYWMNSKAGNLRTSANSANNNANDSFSWYGLGQLNYDNQWGDHKLGVSGIFESSQSTNTSLYSQVIDLRTESVGFWNLNMGTMSDFGNSYSRTSLVSMIGRAMYSFKDRYLLTATIRRDGSSKFQNEKWGNFPSVALAWRASEESFIKNLNVFDNLKIRVSWGITGNQAIDSYSTLGLLSAAHYGWGTATYLPGYITGSPSTPDLTWEKTYQTDVGLDMGIFGNRLSASVDFYQKETKDLLLQKSIPLYDGAGATWINLGEVQNTGIELSLTGVILRNKDSYWESSFNISYSKNEVTNLGGETKLHPGTRINQASLNTAVLQLGEPMGSIYGYHWLGLWRTDEVEEAAKWGQKPGDNKFLDKNNNYILDAEDAGIIGKAFPDYILGWNNTFSWKNLDINLFFQGSFGAERLNLGRYLMVEAVSDSRFVTLKEGYYDMWTPENQDTKVPNPYSTTINTRLESEQYIEKADYVRLKNLSIGYKFPKSIIKTGDIKLTLSAQNLFTITSYSGYDPEGTMDSRGSGGQNDTNVGIDGISYPVPRSYTLGLQFIF